MGLSIKNAETERLVRELAARRGVGVTTAIRLATGNELARDVPAGKDPAAVLAAIRDIQARVAKLPVIDPDVNADGWMYDETGLPR